MNQLSEWDSFYLIVGAAAAALIGLQFVAMTLIAARPKLPSADAGAAFGTPTIVHFCAVLLLSALIRVPWGSVKMAGFFWGLLGLAGVIYAVVTTRRMQVQRLYLPEFEDWLCHSILPLAAYAILLASAAVAWFHDHGALFGVGVAALLLLFVGVHNVWDAVTFHIYVDSTAVKASDQVKAADNKK